MAQNDTQNHRQTDGHGDSMTDPAQRAESVKTLNQHGKARGQGTQNSHFDFRRR